MTTQVRSYYVGNYVAIHIIREIAIILCIREIFKKYLLGVGNIIIILAMYVCGNFVNLKLYGNKT